MNFKRLRVSLAAALGALLIGGVSVAMANNHDTQSNATSNVEEPADVSDTDTLEEEVGDQTGPDDEATEADEADGPGGHEDPAGDVDHQFEGEE